ncbi:MAG: esterase/lipase family protein [Phycisphaerales bacterium JB040]
MRTAIAVLGALLCAGATPLGCAPSVEIHRTTAARTLAGESRSVLTSGELSERTRQTARLNAWPEPDGLPDDPTGAVAFLEDPAWHSSPEDLTALAEILLARSIAAPNPGDRAVLALRAADFAARAINLRLASGVVPLSGRADLARGIQNRAGAIAFHALRTPDEPDHLAGAVETALGSFTVSLATDRHAPWDGTYFDRFIDADTLEVRGVRNHHRVRAHGTPLVGVRDNTPERMDREPFFPPEGIVYPLTLTLAVSPPDRPGGPRHASFTLHDPTRTRTLRVGGHEMPLSSDLTAAFGVLHASTDLARAGQNAMLFAEDLEPRTGLYLLEPYDPTRVPLVLVHGLRSSPLTWRDVVNDLRADPEISSNYQVWMFVYSSGLPIPRNAFYLRDAFRAVRAHYDPRGEHAPVWHALVVGHSMGGVLTRTLLQDMDESLWNAVYTRPLDELDRLSPETVRHLEEVFEYALTPGIARAVLIAAPLRGSPKADSWLGRLGAVWQTLPDELERIGREMRERHPEALSEHIATRNEYFVPTSIDTLSPRSPFLAVYDSVPLDPAIPVHTIAGDRGRPDADPVSDGVVPAWSSTLDGAVSHLVVPAGHEAQSHSLAIAELRRIARLHLRELPRSARGGGSPD